jgi:sugar phosphate permease
MEEDLHLSSSQYDWLLTIFYISYILFEPQAIMWKLLPPHIWAAICVFGWGLVSTIQASINTWSAAMALRFFMGLFEAGYGPGIPYLLSFFYLRHEVGLRVGLFFSAAPLANTFAGALAYGITAGEPGIAKWRVLFLVEGLPTIVMAGVAWRWMPDSPEKAGFLSEEERVVARERGVRQAGKGTRVGGVEWKELGRGLVDVKGWVLGVSSFLSLVSF